MGPRSNERGNQDSLVIAMMIKTLQWGHVQMNVEISSALLSKTKTLPASMGPRSNERGNKMSWTEQSAQVTASMGPRSNERGNSYDATGTCKMRLASMGPRSNERGNVCANTITTQSLRASMGPRSNERGNRNGLAGNFPANTLQWGHVQMNVEM